MKRLGVHVEALRLSRTTAILAALHNTVEWLLTVSEDAWETRKPLYIRERLGCAVVAPANTIAPTTMDVIDAFISELSLFPAPRQRRIEFGNARAFVIGMGFDDEYILCQGGCSAQPVDWIEQLIEHAKKQHDVERTDPL